MPTIDTAAIEVRLAAATPGEWIGAGGKFNGAEYVGVVLADNRKCIVALCGSADDETDALEASCNNAELIAHAPSDIRALLGEVARLREALTQSAEQHKSAAMAFLGLTIKENQRESYFETHHNAACKALDEARKALEGGE